MAPRSPLRTARLQVRRWPSDGSDASGVCLLVENHRSKDRFGHQIVADLRPTFELPNIAAISLLRDVDIKPVARKNRPAEARVVDAHEINEFALRFRTECMDDE